MNKKFFTAALACVLTMGCFAVSAKTYDPQAKVAFSDGSLSVKGSGKGSEALKIFITNPIDKDKNAISLSEFLTKFSTIKDENGTELNFGYMLKGTDNKSSFVSLSTLLKSLDAAAADKAKITSFKLGDFKRGETIQFGYAADSKGTSFVKTPVSLVDVQSEALHHAGFDQDSFFKLDFSEEPFEGEVEILVMGEPLPPATVTLLVALAAGAAFLFFSNRRRQARNAEQA